jgi:hypothetical protein
MQLSAPLWGRPDAKMAGQPEIKPAMCADRGTLGGVDDTRWGEAEGKTEPDGSSRIESARATGTRFKNQESRFKIQVSRDSLLGRS